MCGRFSQQRPASELAEIFSAEPIVDDPGPRYNVAPTDEALVVVQREDRRGVTAYRWGSSPTGPTARKVGSRMFNARAETLVGAPAFRDAFQRKRCLVPVECFYEWRREGAVRQPYTIGRADGGPLVLAGLWDGWRDPATDTGAPLVHDRHVGAERGDGDDPQPDAGDPPRGRLGRVARRALRRPRPAARRCSNRATSRSSRSRAVSQLVNNVRNDGPELVVPI